MKRCFKCGVEKRLFEFYAHKQMADGHLNKCKECAKQDVRKHRSENIERLLEYQRNRIIPEYKLKQNLLRQRTAEGRKIHNEANRIWGAKNRQKKRAHLKVHRALLSGDLVRMPCEVCGHIDGVEGHHEDYSKPLSVNWLCDRHHKARHREINRERWRSEKDQTSSRSVRCEIRP